MAERTGAERTGAERTGAEQRAARKKWVRILSATALRLPLLLLLLPLLLLLLLRLLLPLLLLLRPPWRARGRPVVAVVEKLPPVSMQVRLHLLRRSGPLGLSRGSATPASRAAMTRKHRTEKKALNRSKGSTNRYCAL